MKSMKPTCIFGSSSFFFLSIMGCKLIYISGIVSIPYIVVNKAPNVRVIKKQKKKSNDK